MPKVEEETIYINAPKRYTAFLDAIKAVGFDKKEVVIYALDQIIRLDKKDLVQKLAVFRLGLIEEGVEVRLP